MAVTLRQVAKAAQVSVSVASRALNGHAKTYRISEETEDRVRQVAQQLGFRPSQTARSLRLQKTGLLGVVIPDLSNPFFGSISRAVALAAEAEGYSVIVADSREVTEHEIELINQLESRQVEALVVCPVGQKCEHLHRVLERGTPLVLVDRTFPDQKFLQVTSHHEKGALKATGLLTSNGHRTIGVLQGLPGTLPNDQRLAGYATALNAAGVPFDPSLVSGDSFSEASGYASTIQLLSQRPEITALFALSTPNAMGALRAIRDLEKTVPGDLSLVAFDDSPYADLMHIPLTTVCQNVDLIGQKAASLVMQFLNGKSPKRKASHLIQVHVVKRDSINRIK